MRDLITASFIVVILIGCWLFFDSYSEKEVNELAYTITEEIIPSIEAEAWEQGNEQLKVAESKWDSYKTIAHLFLCASELNEIDYGMAKVIEYAEAEDVSNTSGELSALAQQLIILNSHEKITPENIF
ncbi:MAG: DUF4363 family protein [Firmicutes bacterium]|nr:DUF4363 family protein [Bacillota bacterium]